VEYPFKELYLKRGEKYAHQNYIQQVKDQNESYQNKQWKSARFDYFLKKITAVFILFFFKLKKCFSINSVIQLA